MLMKGRKCRIKVTDSLNKKLDAMDSANSADVYAPKEDKDNNFLNLVGEEIYFGVTEDEKIKNEKHEKMSKIGNKIFNAIILVIVLIGFVAFIGIVIKINA